MDLFRKLFLSFNKANTNRSWHILSAIIFICIFICLSFLYVGATNSNKDNHDLQEALASIQSTLQTSSEERKVSESLLLEKLNSQNQLISEQGVNLDSLSVEIDSLESRLNTSAHQISTLSTRNEYLVGFIKDSLDGNSDTPLSFSYLQSDSWNSKKEEISMKMGLPNVKILGDHSNFTLEHTGVSDMHFDGVGIKSFGILNTKNNFSNIIYLRAPGLAIIPNDHLEVHADKMLDHIVLDGCLTWKKISFDDDFESWEAKDINDDTRTLKITSNVVTKEIPICDNRYLMNYKLAALSTATTSVHPTDNVVSISSKQNTSAPPDKPFGGIGIVLEDGDISAGIKIKSIIGGKPAHKAGIRETDIIIKIDDIPVFKMSRDEAVSKMRGPVGSSVKLTILSLKHKKNEPREVTLGREFITVADQRDHHGTPSDLVWEVSDIEKHFVITPNQIAEGKNTKVFLARNTGKEIIEPRHINVTDRNGQKKKTWEILPESTCTTSQVLPGDTCTVVVKASPVMDGEMSGIISITGQREYPSKPENLLLTGYARNIAGQLPDHVIGNGDPCPKVGEKAEIAISSISGFKSNDGYFDFGHGQQNKFPKFFTAECESWQLGKDDILYCNNPGQGFHTSTMREYSSQDINGPWEQVRIEDRHISARLTCRDGILENVKWTW